MLRHIPLFPRGYMTKEEIKNKIEDIYNRFDTWETDESISTLYKEFVKIKNDLGEVLQEIEDDIKEEAKGE